MQVKVFEIRDSGTMFAVVAIDMNPFGETVAQYDAQKYFLRRCGYACDGEPNIAITHLSANGGAFWNDPYGWKGRTYPVAHNYIIEHWHELTDGDVIDVEHILGETATKKISERFTEK